MELSYKETKILSYILFPKFYDARKFTNLTFLGAPPCNMYKKKK